MITCKPMQHVAVTSSSEGLTLFSVAMERTTFCLTMLFGTLNSLRLDSGEVDGEFIDPDSFEVCLIRRLAAMKSSWQTDTGTLECRWSDVGRRVEYKSAWMQEACDIRGAYLPPITDFASHSPFGGASWLEAHGADYNSE